MSDLDPGRPPDNGRPHPEPPATSDRWRQIVEEEAGQSVAAGVAFGGGLDPEGYRAERMSRADPDDLMFGYDLGGEG